MNDRKFDPAHKTAVNVVSFAADIEDMADAYRTLVTLAIGLGLLTSCGNVSARGQRAARDEVRYQVVVTAAAMLGTPYHYGGSSPQGGFDCSGLVQYSYAQAGITLPRTALALFRRLRHIRIRLLRPGDVLFFKLNGKRVSHVAIYLGDNRFIHAPKTGSDVTIGSLDNHYWRSHLVSAGRVF